MTVGCLSRASPSRASLFARGPHLSGNRRASSHADLFQFRGRDSVPVVAYLTFPSFNRPFRISPTSYLSVCRVILLSPRALRSMFLR